MCRVGIAGGLAGCRGEAVDIDVAVVVVNVSFNVTVEEGRGSMLWTMPAVLA